MISEPLIGAVTLLAVLNASVPPRAEVLLVSESSIVYSKHDLNLTTRLPEKEASQIFADNILLTLHYLKGDMGRVKGDKGDINWGKVREPFEVSFVLNPKEIFAYHDTLLPEFKDKAVKTTNAHFVASEGFKPLAGLFGNGVCHLASLIHWAASDAGLEVVSLVNHDFYPVPGVPRERGTSIRWSPDGSLNSRNQNLYIKNNFAVPIFFRFQADNKLVTLTVSK